MKIKLMNLQRQNNALKDEIIKKIDDIVTMSYFIMGDYVKEFEKKLSHFHNSDYAIGVGNGTDALTISLIACGVKPGDEVIVPAMTFFATAEAVSSIGAIPVFADIHSDYYTICLESVEKLLSDKTKAIIPVHLYGQPADIIGLKKIVDGKGIKIIEDSCQAIGSSDRGVLTSIMGDVGVTSFFPTKNLGAFGDGGAIITNDTSIANHCKALRVHGSGLLGMKVSGLSFENSEYFEFRDSKYNNSIIGYNSRLDEIQAAVLSTKIEYLRDWNNNRNDIAKRYNSEIKNPNILLPEVRKGVIHVYYTYIIRVKNRKHFMEYMKDNGIETGVYFPIPLHKQYVYFEDYGHLNLPNSEQLAKENVALPIFPELNDDEIKYIISVLNGYEV